MAENTQEIVVFEEDTAPIISEILGKYNLLENEEQVLEKAEKEETLRPDILLYLTEAIVLGKIPKDSLTASIQKELNTSNQIAQSIATDVINKLLPLGRKADQEDLKFLQRQATPIEPEEKEGEFESMPMYENPEAETEKPLPTRSPLPRIEEEEAPLRRPSTIETSEPPRTSDSYREPIE